MKFTIPAVLAVFSLAACDWDADRKQALADAALIQVQALNAQGVNPVKLDETQLAWLASSCALIQVAVPEVSDDVARTCAVATEAAK